MRIRDDYFLRKKIHGFGVVIWEVGMKDLFVWEVLDLSVFVVAAKNYCFFFYAFVQFCCCNWLWYSDQEVERFEAFLQQKKWCWKSTQRLISPPQTNWENYSNSPRLTVGNHSSPSPSFAVNSFHYVSPTSQNEQLLESTTQFLELISNLRLLRQTPIQTDTIWLNLNEKTNRIYLLLPWFKVW